MSLQSARLFLIRYLFFFVGYEFLFVFTHTGMKSHVKESLKKHDIYIKPKSFDLKLLGKSIIKQVWVPWKWWYCN